MTNTKGECVGINTANYMAKSEWPYQWSEDNWNNTERLSAEEKKKKIKA